MDLQERNSSRASLSRCFAVWNRDCFLTEIQIIVLLLSLFPLQESVSLSTYSVRPEASYFRQKPLSIVFIEEELQKGRSPLTLLRLIRPGLLPGLSSPNSAGGGFTDVTASH
ncbi:hypothetical protein DTO166G4_2883 [Paecilomyces variotii]|nr:hypothetical protein DTO166G4_2883 [Paecilomyces variotii]KAJ9233193.1 hypothetical protein DTO166G5_5781 [Paecilomyces variotii]KAJ9257361.1 hypothetical protein DTO207G8_2115 [Paecilomyces variotii]KAJ9257514.1 hypothetical protein DTO195F2_5496 [Paecilomyces variotii]KAJ9304345.1 hypothetical protein DTO217A2_6191 [Paecilomyces variotii]